MASPEANRIIQGLRKQFESQAFSASTLGLVVNGLVITGKTGHPSGRELFNAVSTRLPNSNCPRQTCKSILMAAELQARVWKLN